MNSVLLSVCLLSYIHTNAIKHNLVPAEVISAQASIIYANETDGLNVAIFDMTAKQ